MTLETALKAPAAEGEEEAEDEDAPKGRVVAFDVSCAAPVAKDARPLSPEAFAAVKARLRVVEWRRRPSAKPETDAENKRMVASVKRKQASLAYAAAAAKGEDAHMEDDAVDAIGLAVLGSEDLLEVDDVPDAPEHFGALAEKVSRALGATEASVLQGLVASRAHASELVASSIHGLDTVRLDATGGALDEEEEEFDGASIQLTDGNERRATCRETRVKHPCRIYVGRPGHGVLPGGNGSFTRRTTGWRGCWCGWPTWRWLRVRLTLHQSKFLTCIRVCLRETSGRKSGSSYWSSCFLASWMWTTFARDVTTCLCRFIKAAPPIGHSERVGSPHFFEEWRAAPVAEGRPARRENHLSAGRRRVRARVREAAVPRRRGPPGVGRLGAA